MLCLKNKTAKWCVVVCLIGGLVTSSSVVASQVKKTGIVDSVKLNRELPSPPSEIKLSYKGTTDIIKSIETKSPRFDEASDIPGQYDASNNENTESANIPAANDIKAPIPDAPHMTEPYKKAVDESGYLMWDWNIDSKDWYYRDKRLVDYTIAQIVEQSKKQEPLVILLHEREETLAQLPELLKYLKEQNYSFKALEAKMTPIHLK